MRRFLSAVTTKQHRRCKNIISVFSFHVWRWKILFSDWWRQVSALRGVDWVGGVRRAVSLSKALWVGGPVCFATPDLQRSHPTARGQSKPHHARESEEDSWLSSKGGRRISDSWQKGVWVFVVENLSLDLSSPFCFLQGCWELALQSE